MRRILIGSAAAVLAMTTAAMPAMAQYGGSPEEQVDRDFDNDDDASEAAEDLRDAAADTAEDAEAYPEDDGLDMSADPEDRGALEDEGPAPVAEEQSEGDTWQGEDGRSYCRRSDGTTGLVVGGGAGALIGRGIDRRGERGTGTIIGAIAGALVGSAIERSANEQRCR
ncbi:MAG TPA: glycine zipper 2TM domain-containing protein [Allosphingosinicella sp.]|nr:glycine zipper 2TM domain-containing protein [Allosphingosinicella sp.]